MASAWQPAPEAASEIVRLLQLLSDPTQAQQHAHGQQVLTQFGSNPEFGLYLSHLLAHDLHGVPSQVRQLSGLVLKTQVKSSYSSLPAEAQAVIRTNTVTALNDVEVSIRSAAGNVVAAVVTCKGCGGLAGWPDLLPSIASMLGTGQEYKVDGALDALLKVMEDGLGGVLDSRALARDVAPLVPRLLPLLGAAAAPPRVRLGALKCVNALVPLMPAGLYEGLGGCLGALAELGRHENAQIRKAVVQGLVLMLDACFDALWGSMPGICEFMLTALQDAEESVALEAGEFWIAYCELGRGLELIVDYLPKLVPVLLSRMVYSQEDIADFGAEDPNNDHIPDRPEDIAPMFRRKKGEDGDGSSVDSWNVRKCCAAAMDVVSGTFGPDVLLPQLLPHLQTALGSTDVWVRESAILCLGAVCSGSGTGIEEYLPQLAPFLLAQVRDACPQLRCMACWCLSRYTAWIAAQPPEAYFAPMVQLLLERVLDHNKKVQEAACSALSTVQEVATEQLMPYLEAVAAALAQALGRYQVRSLVVLYDTIGTLADCIGSDMAHPQVSGPIMPPLMAKWARLDASDRHVFSLMECMTSLAAALGLAFQDHAQPVFSQCLSLIEHTLMGQGAAELQGGEAPDVDFAVCALDLLTSVVEGLGASVEGLVGGSNLLQLLLECMKSSEPDVRQSAFALVGDLAKAVMPRLAPALPTYMPLLIANIEPAHKSVCNNASWAVGEISTRAGAAVAPHIPALMERLLYVLSIPAQQHRPQTYNEEEEQEAALEEYLHRAPLLENACITVARLADACPEALAPQLPSYCSKWCQAFSCVRDRGDRELAFRALLKLVQRNPDGLMPGFTPFCIAVAGWHTSPAGDEQPPEGPPSDLAQLFRHLLVSVRDRLPLQWASTKANMPAEAWEMLTNAYGL